MIIEVRNYRVKSGSRDEFIRFFTDQAIPAQLRHGMRIAGPLLDVENPDRFVWLRSFSSPEEREEQKNAFYGGAQWKDELEPVAMSMLESYDVTLCETSAGSIFMNIGVAD